MWISLHQKVIFYCFTTFIFLKIEFRGGGKEREREREIDFYIFPNWRLKPQP